MTELANPPDWTSTQAYGINNHGQIVGHGHDSSGYKLALLWEGGQVIDLNTVIEPLAGNGGNLRLTNAVAINESGVIAVAGSLRGAQRAYLLVPIAEPSTLALAFTVLLPLAWAARRRRKN